MSKIKPYLVILGVALIAVAVYNYAKANVSALSTLP